MRLDNICELAIDGSVSKMLKSQSNSAVDVMRLGLIHPSVEFWFGSSVNWTSESAVFKFCLS